MNHVASECRSDFWGVQPEPPNHKLLHTADNRGCDMWSRGFGLKLMSIFSKVNSSDYYWKMWSEQVFNPSAGI